MTAIVKMTDIFCLVIFFLQSQLLFSHANIYIDVNKNLLQTSQQSLSSMESVPELFPPECSVISATSLISTRRRTVPPR